MKLRCLILPLLIGTFAVPGCAEDDDDALSGASGPVIGDDLLHRGGIDPEGVADCYVSCQDMSAGLREMENPDVIEKQTSNVLQLQQRCAELLDLLPEDEQEEAKALAGHAYAACQSCDERCDIMLGSLTELCDMYGLGDLCPVLAEVLAPLCAEHGCSPLPSLCQQGCGVMVEQFVPLCLDATGDPFLCDFAQWIVMEQCMGALCPPTCEATCQRQLNEALEACWPLPDPFLCLQETFYASETCFAGCCPTHCDDTLRGALVACGDDRACARQARHDRDACVEACPGPPPPPECGNGICEPFEEMTCIVDCCYGEVCDGWCANTDWDPMNCGGCGITCQAGEACAAGTCVTSNADCGGACPDGMLCCDQPSTPEPDGVCVDGWELMWNSQHCGACSVSCDDGWCLEGVCTCPADFDPPDPGFARCGPDQACTDLRDDPLNCGACDVACQAGEACASGTCVASNADCGGACSDGALCCDQPSTPEVDGVCIEGWELMWNNQHCGACSMSCDDGWCEMGVCTCPADFDPPDPGFARCGPDQACTFLWDDPLNCGACDVACSASETCWQGSCCLPNGAEYGADPAACCSGVDLDVDGLCDDICWAGLMEPCFEPDSCCAGECQFSELHQMPLCCVPDGEPWAPYGDPWFCCNFDPEGDGVCGAGGCTADLLDPCEPGLDFCCQGQCDLAAAAGGAMACCLPDGQPYEGLGYAPEVCCNEDPDGNGWCGTGDVGQPFLYVRIDDLSPQANTPDGGADIDALVLELPDGVAYAETFEAYAHGGGMGDDVDPASVLGAPDAFYLYPDLSVCDVDTPGLFTSLGGFGGFLVVKLSAPIVTNDVLHVYEVGGCDYGGGIARPEAISVSVSTSPDPGGVWVNLGEGIGPDISFLIPPLPLIP